MVTYNINGMNQDEWINECVTELKKHTDREIKVRNKQETLIMNGGEQI